MDVLLTIALICVVALLSVLLSKWRHGYWMRKGIPQLEPEFFFGDIKKLLTEQPLATVILGFYREFKKRGVKHGDLNLVKRILTQDFSYFMDHGLFHHENDMLSENLLNLEGNQWKQLRAKLTPTFTSGKMKIMFETLVEKTDKLQEAAQEYTANNRPFQIKDLLVRFTTDVIGSCAFGIECNSLKDKDNDFLVKGREVFNFPWYKFVLESLVPWNILGKLGYKTFGGRHTESFFQNLVLDTMKYREENNIYRKDFMHLMIQLKNKGELTDDASLSKVSNKGINSLTENEVIAQSFLFWAAGFETSATTMTFTFLNLAQNQEVQDKLREEVKEVLKKHEGNMTYEAVMEMTYLEKVIYETLRLYPPLGMIPRICTNDYKIPGENITISKGTFVNIPVWGIHMDPEYYPEPEKFNPENFSEKNKAKRPDFTWLPFGEDPRMCLGLRFGMLQSRVGIASLIRNFKFTLSEKTKLPIELQKNSIISQIKGELWMNMTKI